MRKQLRLVIIMVCVVAVLVGGLVFVKTSNLFTASSSSSSTSAAVKLINTNVNNIQKVLVSNKAGSYTITWDSTNSWNIDQLKGISTVEDTITSACTDLSTLGASRIIENNASDLSKYGLDKPQATLDITIKNQGELVYNIGNKSPLADGYYMTEKGKNKVYLCTTDLDSYFLASDTVFVDTKLVSIATTSLVNSISKMFFGGAKSQHPFEIDCKGPSTAANTSTTAALTGTIASPKLTADPTNISTITTAITSLAADKAVSLDVSKASLTKYGLATPQYTYSFLLSNKMTTLNFGNTFTDSGTEYVYVMVAGRNVIYRIATSTVTFYNWQLKDLASELQFLPSIDDLKTMTIQTPTQSYTFTFSGTSSDLKVAYNGKTLNTTYFKDYYERMLNNVSLAGFAKQPTGMTLQYKVTCVSKNAKTATQYMEFYTYDSQRYYWNVNGTSDLYLLKMPIDKLFDLVNNIIAGQDVATN